MKILLLSIAPVIIALLLQIPQSPSQPPAPRTGRTSSQNDKNKSPSKQSKQAVAYHDDKQTNSIPPTVDKPTAEVNSREKQADGTPEKGAPSVPGWLKASTIISAAATLLIAVLAGFQAWVIHKQRLAMDQQAQYMSNGLILTKQAADAATASAEIARQALILTQAADIHIDNVTANPDGRITKNTRLTVIVKNFGKTPASDLTTNLTLSAGDRHLVKIPPEAQKAIVLGAAQSQGVIFEPLNSELSAEDLTKVLSGELALSVYGEIRYCDVFRQRHLITCSLTLDDNIRSFRIDHYDTSVAPPAEWQSTNAKK